MKRTILLVIALALVLVLTGVSQTPSGPKHRVVFQLNEPVGDAWDDVIVHATNLRAAFSKDGGSQVEIVFFGDGINMLLKTNTRFAARLQQLADAGVTLAACQNAMRGRDLKTEDLFPFATQVDAGVAELARKQEAGWAYIH
jgi:intracellular sulfur oxidation DsrE/DsrF family protein